jgi:hypothetical protein
MCSGEAQSTRSGEIARLLKPDIGRERRQPAAIARRRKFFDISEGSMLNGRWGAAPYSAHPIIFRIPDPRFGPDVL